MQWTVAKGGQIRTRRKFLWFPLYFYGVRYWLERVTLMECYTAFDNCGWWRVINIKPYADYWHRGNKFTGAIK